MKRLVRWHCAAMLVAALLVPLQTLESQEVKGSWNIIPRVGLVTWDNQAALQDPVFQNGRCDYPDFSHSCSSVWSNMLAGVALSYFVTDVIAVGLAFDFGRPVTNGTYFPAVNLEVGGQQHLVFVNERLTIAQYGVLAEFVPRAGRLGFFVNGGLGGYSVWPEASKADFSGVSGNTSFTDLMLTVGGGLQWSIRSNFGFRLELSDMIYTGWDRNNLYPVQNWPNPLKVFNSELFPDLVEEPPSESSTLHNFRLSIGLTFRAGGGS